MVRFLWTACWSFVGFPPPRPRNLFIICGGVTCFHCSEYLLCAWLKAKEKTYIQCLPSVRATCCWWHHLVKLCSLTLVIHLEILFITTPWRMNLRKKHMERSIWHILNFLTTLGIYLPFTCIWKLLDSFLVLFSLWWHACSWAVCLKSDYPVLICFVRFGFYCSLKRSNCKL